MIDYGLWCLKDIRHELRRRNARVTGRKCDLVEMYNSLRYLFINSLLMINDV